MKRSSSICSAIQAKSDSEGAALVTLLIMFVSKAWHYGKLLVVLLVEKLLRHATAVPPWGYRLEALAPA